MLVSKFTVEMVAPFPRFSRFLCWIAAIADCGRVLDLAILKEAEFLLADVEVFTRLQSGHGLGMLARQFKSA